MKYYLIRDKQGNIVIQNFDFDVDSPMCTKTTISKLKKHFRLIHYLESDLKLAERKKESYSNYLNEYLEVVEVEVELDVKILNN